ncbi:MAG: dienelactone hydrolase family protein [Bacteroidetes bacterium]|nr:dienelactone hydrolase family protein [Bacteroidota bacterium]
MTIKRKHFTNVVLAFLIISCVQAQDKSNTKSDYETIGVVNDLPSFTNKVKGRLDFPASWLSGNYSNFNSWRKEAKQIVFASFLAKPPDAPFKPVVIGSEDRGSYTAKKIVLNITADSRILGYLLIPKGEGPFPAALLLHDHGAKFDIGKEKVIRPFGVSGEVVKSSEEWVVKYYGGKFIGDELAKKGYVCFATDALNWGDRGGAGYEGQQSLASNLLNLGMSYAGLIAYEDINAAKFLSAVPDVDSKKIASVGFSMGSFRAWQLAAMSDDISAAVAISSISTTAGSMSVGNNKTRGQSSFTMTHPGLVNYLDYPDVASIACPKPMLLYNGENDHLFPVEDVKKVYKKMRQYWQSQNASAKLETKTWNAKHEFNIQMQTEAFRWLDTQFNKEN